MNTVEEYERNGLRVRIIQDPDPLDPEECDSPVYLAAFHRQFTNCSKELPFSSGEGMRQWLRSNPQSEEWAVFPVEAYIHGGVALALAGSDDAASFPDRRWDVSLIGAVFVRKDGGWLGVSLSEVAEAHVETWNQYLSGDVYGFIVDKLNGCSHCGHTDYEDVDSCWGFYGIEDAKAEANANADHYHHEGEE